MPLQAESHLVAPIGQQGLNVNATRLMYVCNVKLLQLYKEYRDRVYQKLTNCRPRPIYY